MLIRDKVGEEIKKTISEVKSSQVQVVSLTDNEDFFRAIISKIKSEIEVLLETKSIDSLAEVVELVDWIQICFGSTGLDSVIEHRKEKLGLYWNRYYIKEDVEEEK